MDSLTPRALSLIAWLFATAPVLAQSDPTFAPAQLTLRAPTGMLGDQCRKIETPDTVVPLSLHRTFHDDFDAHPLSGDRWVPHYAGGAAWPEAQYWGGAGSDFKRKTSWNGEQQIYVDPRYGGPATPPPGPPPFRARGGRSPLAPTPPPPTPHTCPSPHN